ncbi:MAG: hypothetical protein BWK76_11400 [Desulfobulbaceae bacterium A2]|nr:MAG: hypothetical protein BWK76_11400 [Desulfobulbaceae bacterium A2]
MSPRTPATHRYHTGRVLGLAAGFVLCAASAGAAELAAVEFTPTPAPATDADMLRTYSASKAVLKYKDGSSKEYPLSYNVLFKTTDKVAGSANEAARLYDVEGKALVDPNGDPVVAETPDANSLLQVGGKLFLVTHYEYDWLLANGEDSEKVAGWHGRMPMSMTLTNITQDKENGALKASGQRPIDFSSVGGLWIPCFGSQTPWNTHLGSEEDYDLYFTKASGDKLAKKTSGGLKAMSEIYFQGKKQANPYQYGYLTEVAVTEDGSTSVTKHYNLGRATWEMGKIMPDGKTIYFGDDGDHVGLFMFVADQKNNLAAGTLYAARWQQESAENGGKGKLSWVRLGHARHDEIKKLIEANTSFEDIFEYTTPEQNADWAKAGFKRIRAGHSGDEYLKLKPGKEQAAAFLEPRRYAAILGATTEFNKMEGVAVDARKKTVYVAMSYVEKGMAKEEDAAADHIQLAKLKAGATYAISTGGKRKDTNGKAIASDWVGVAMSVPAGLLGEDIKADALGNTAAVDKVANPDNIFFSEKMRTLFIGEDSGTHVNNFVWAYNVDSGSLTRVLSVAAGAESTGLQVLDNMNGHAYVMSNCQHQGEWLKSMPEDVKKRLTEAAKQSLGVNRHGTPNYYLEANVGYLGGMPGL